MAISRQLLEPSLSNGKMTGIMYSSRAHFLTAFFGGIFAFLWFSVFSLDRVGKLRDYRGFMVITTLLSLLFSGLLIICSLPDLPNQLVVLKDLAPGINDHRSIIGRVFSMLACAVFCRVAQPLFKMSDLSAEDYPSPWGSAISSTVLGLVTTVFVVLITLALLP